MHIFTLSVPKGEEMKMKVILTVNSKGNVFNRLNYLLKNLDASCNISARMIPRNKNDGK